MTWIITLLQYFLEKTGHEGLNNIISAYPDKSAYAQCIFAYCKGRGQEVVVFVGRTEGLSKHSFLRLPLQGEWIGISLDSNFFLWTDSWFQFVDQTPCIVQPQHFHYGLLTWILHNDSYYLMMDRRFLVSILRYSLLVVTKNMIVFFFIFFIVPLILSFNLIFRHYCSSQRTCYVIWMGSRKYCIR